MLIRQSMSEWVNEDNVPKGYLERDSDNVERASGHGRTAQGMGLPEPIHGYTVLNRGKLKWSRGA